MSRTKLLRNFLILSLVIAIALIIGCSIRSIQNEEPAAVETPVPLIAQEACIVEELILPVQNPDPLTSEEPDPEPAPPPLTQMEKIELYVQNAVSLYPNLTVDLIDAVIWRESRYNPDARNYNGTCVGLMQLSTKWHSKRARALGVDNLYDPYGNILTGCDLLSELLNSYSLETALMVYHGGYSYAKSYRESGAVDQYTKDILSYANRSKEVA